MSDFRTEDICTGHLAGASDRPAGEADSAPGVLRDAVPGGYLGGHRSVRRGVDRKIAGEFSFLLSIPAILGAFILELKDFGSMSSSIGVGAVIAGCVAAFLSGFFALATFRISARLSPFRTSG